jgi:hypothetical protein
MAIMDNFWGGGGVKIGKHVCTYEWYSPLVSSPLVSYSNDVASAIIVIVRHRRPLATGRFRNHWGYFNETWCEDTFGQYAQSFFDFRDLTYFVADIFC